MVRKSSENKKCFITLHFNEVVKVILYEDYGTVYYSDIILVKQEDGLYYLSLYPAGNTCQPSEEDDLVIIAKRLKIKEKE
ncbi:hypothetical protein HNQ92_004271 [Rhabdobacter roseus]|uniref:Uncharacterized protein n=1 Tax=Rhabdobacter roseus TaxID=1655419 RepID=A0A840TQI9_9BACT|nr:hypothetical protein [Rhabdobacter roseus]